MKARTGRPGHPPTAQLCKHCGKSFTAYLSRRKRRRFCSHTCYGKWLSWIHSAEYLVEQSERDAENRSWRGFSTDERALHG